MMALMTIGHLSSFDTIIMPMTHFNHKVIRGEQRYYNDTRLLLKAYLATVTRQSVYHHGGMRTNTI